MKRAVRDSYQVNTVEYFRGETRQRGEDNGGKARERRCGLWKAKGGVEGNEIDEIKKKKEDGEGRQRGNLY